MKFSLKNKEFNKKRLNIFQRKSVSPNFKSLSKDSLSKSKSPINKNQKHNATVSYDQVNMNLEQQKNYKQPQINHSALQLSEIQEQNAQLINSHASNGQNNLIKSINKNFQNCQRQLNLQLSKTRERRNIVLPLSKPIQSVYHQQQKSIRQNRLINTPQIQINTLYHPSKQIVFQPINRKSKSKSEQRQISAKNVKVAKQYNYTIKGNNLQPNPNKQKIIQKLDKSLRTHQAHEISHLTDYQIKNSQFIQQIKQLKQVIDQQHLQIKYLKNQKEIMESNQILQYDSKEQNYKKSNKQSPQKKHRNQQKLHDQQQQTSKLLDLYHILVQNQQKMKAIQDRQRNLSASVLIYIQKIERKLIEIVSVKYVSYRTQLEQKLKQFDKYISKCGHLQQKLNLYSNTVRSVNQSLRITKLKQQNIELQIKQSKVQRNYPKKQNQQQYNQNSQFGYNFSKDEMFKKIPQDCQSDISSIKRVQYDLDEFQQKQQNKELYVLSKNLQNNGSFHNDDESISSFLQQKYSHLIYKRQNNKRQQVKHKANQNVNQNNQGLVYRQRLSPQSHRADHQSQLRSQIYQIQGQGYGFPYQITHNQNLQKLSPFQANQMFNYKQHDFKNHKNRSFYQFQDYQSNQFQSQNYENNFKISHNVKRKKIEEISFQSPHAGIKKDLISDTLQEEQARIICLLQQKKSRFPVQCWIDKMGCLRRKNHTYLFDSEGNVLVTTQVAFKKLCDQNVFSRVT